jgi:hypothetical protein
LVRVGVQSLNSDTLAAVDRKGDHDKVRACLGHLQAHDLHYSVDHIIGLPGEGSADQVAALRFYNEVRPNRIIAHWMTYFPGTTALEQAHKQGLLDDAAVRRILDGEVGDGYIYGGNVRYRDQEELERISGLFDLLPLLPRGAVAWLLERDRYKRLPAMKRLRQLGALALAASGEEATREHMRHIFATVLTQTGAALRARM